jgi:tyrosine-protein phosphatase SIW14
MHFFVRIFRVFLFATLFLSFPSASTSLSDNPSPSPAEKISIPSVHNAGKINEHLYRGSQPDLSELYQLKKLGVNIIIDLRAESPRTAEEERIRAEALGMRFHRIPIGGFSNPTTSDLVHFFQILRDSPDQSIFVHCEFGRDRTGVMIAAYRIAFEHWSSEQAISEMMRFGFNRPWHPSMLAFIRRLPIRLQSDAELIKALHND